MNRLVNTSYAVLLLIAVLVLLLAAFATNKVDSSLGVYILSFVIISLLGYQSHVIRAQKKLIEGSAKKNIFEALVATMPVGVILKDAKDDFRFLVCNDAARRIFAKDSVEVVGKTDFDLFDAELSKKIRAADEHLCQSGVSEATDQMLMNFGYGGVWIKSQRLAVRCRGTYLVCIIEDVTECISLEERLCYAKRINEIGILAGGIAHEFNNYLQVILGYCEFLKADISDEAAHENIDQVISAANSSMKLTQQLLTYSRKAEMQRETSDLVELVRNCLKMADRLMGEDIKLEFIPGAELVLVSVDSAKIEQTIINLCVNARDALQGKGTVRVEVDSVIEVLPAIDRGIRKHANQQFAVIRVSDDGPGIPDDLVAKVFLPFYTTKEMGKGTGLGLATVYAILKQHDGYVFYDAAPEGGARFSLYIPVIEHALEQTTNQGSEHKLSEGLRRGLTVLLAEDEEAVRKMTKTLLTKKGINVIEARDGEEAVKLFKAHADKISLLVFDVMMPIKTGKAAFDEIRRLAPEIPAIFCTGYSDEGLRHEIQAVSNVRLLAKPFKTAQLIDAITELII